MVKRWLRRHRPVHHAAELLAQERQVIAASWLRDSATKHSYVKGGGGDYGYGWHLLDFQQNGRPIHAINAGGNGGQLLYIIPDLDMTESEIIAQLSAVEEMSEATEYFSDDQLERWLMSEVRRG